MIERLRKGNLKRLSSLRFGSFNFPSVWIGRLPIGWRDLKNFLEIPQQRIPGGVLPVPINAQSVPLARFEGWTNVFEWFDAPLDAAGVDEQGQPHHGRIPKFFINFQEWKFYRFTGVIAQMNVVVNVPAA